MHFWIGWFDGVGPGPRRRRAKGRPSHTKEKREDKEKKQGVSPSVEIQVFCCTGWLCGVLQRTYSVPPVAWPPAWAECTSVSRVRPIFNICRGVWPGCHVLSILGFWGPKFSRQKWNDKIACCYGYTLPAYVFVVWEREKQRFVFLCWDFKHV